MEDHDFKNLSMCKQIVNINGGDVEVYCKGVNQGTIFQFSMVMEQRQAEPKGDPAPALL